MARVPQLGVMLVWLVACLRALAGVCDRVRVYLRECYCVCVFDALIVRVCYCFCV